MFDPSAKTKSEDHILRKKLLSLIKALIVALWATSLSSIAVVLWLGVPPKNLPSLGDMATLLFGASSLALILFSILIGAVALVGYDHLKKDVRDEVQKATFERINLLEKELRGSVVSSIGLMMGVIHEQHEYKDYLAEAVLHCQQAYKNLKDVEGNAKYTALNNLVYYACLLGTEDRRDSLLEYARTLKAVGQDLDFPEYLLTYCRAVLQFSPRADEVREALLIAEALCRKKLTERQMKEATSYVASLAQKLPKQLPLTKSN